MASQTVAAPKYTLLDILKSHRAFSGFTLVLPPDVAADVIDELEALYRLRAEVVKLVQTPDNAAVQSHVLRELLT